MAGDVTVAVVWGQLGQLAAGTEADFTKSGFGTPKACIVLLNEDPSDNTSVATQSKMSIGFSDFTDNYCITHQDEDASAKVDCDALKSKTRCYSTLTVAGADDTYGTASTITDGVKLTHASGSSTDFATVIMFGGADLAVSLQLDSTPNGVDSTATISHSGFTDGNDKLIFFIGMDKTGEDSAGSGITNSFGVCHATGSDGGGWTFVQRCIGYASDHNNNDGSPSAIISTEHVLDIVTETGGGDWAIEVTALEHSTNTWTITERDVASGNNHEIYSLALDLDDRSAKVGSVDAPFSGTSWAPSVSLGFTPQYVGLGLTQLSNEDTIASSANGGVLGISSNTGSGEETCHGWYNENAAATTNTNNNFRSRVIDLRNSSVAITLQDHSHSSFDSGGWTYTINSEDDSSARKWFYWAIEEASAGVNQESIVATAAGVTTLDLLIFKTLAASAQGIPNINKTAFKTIEATATGVPLLARIKLRLQAIAAVATGVATLAKMPLLSLRATATGVPDIALLIFKTLRATAAGVTGLVVDKIGGVINVAIAAVATGVAELNKTVFKTLEATAQGNPAIRLLVGITLRATATGVAVLNRVKLALVAIAATAAGVPSLALMVGKNLSATATGIPTLAKTVFKSIAATALGVPALAKTIFKTIAATAAGIGGIAVNHIIAGAGVVNTVAITAVATGVATLEALYVQFFAPFTGGSGLSTLDRTATRWKRRQATWKRRR